MICGGRPPLLTATVPATTLLGLDLWPKPPLQDNLARRCGTVPPPFSRRATSRPLMSPRAIAKISESRIGSSADFYALAMLLCVVPNGLR